MTSIQRNENPEDVFEVLERLGEGCVRGVALDRLLGLDLLLLLRLLMCDVLASVFFTLP